MKLIVATKTICPRHRTDDQITKYTQKTSCSLVIFYHLWRRLSAKIVKVLRLYLLQHEESLRRNFPLLRLYKGISDSPSPNFPDLHQNKKMKSCTDPAAPFPCVPGTKTIKFWKKPRDISLP